MKKNIINEKRIVEDEIWIEEYEFDNETEEKKVCLDIDFRGKP